MKILLIERDILLNASNFSVFPCHCFTLCDCTLSESLSTWFCYWVEFENKEQSVRFPQEVHDTGVTCASLGSRSVLSLTACHWSTVGPFRAGFRHQRTQQRVTRIQRPVASDKPRLPSPGHRHWSRQLQLKAKSSGASG